MTKKRRTSTNRNLNKAKKAKNDEFYTKLSDIENELSHYKDHFRDKIIYCNCDDPYRSNFVKYFALNFKFLGLKQLIATCYKHPDVDDSDFEEVSDRPIKWVYNGEQIEEQNYPDLSKAVVIELKGDGDFRSEECVALLKECDIVVTNPPFSLFRDFVDLLIENDKKFITIGSQNNISNINIFNYIHQSKLWLGINNVNKFICHVSDEKNINKNVKFDPELNLYIAVFGNIGWYTNLEHDKRNKDIILYKKYNENDYPKYDNYNAINVSRVKEIPSDYAGLMGVPITFMKNYNPNQFEIIGNSHQLAEPTLVKGKIKKVRRFYLNEKCLYDRIIIRNRKPQLD